MQTVEQTARRRKSNAEKFLVLMLGGGVILAALSFLFLRFGAESLSLSDILNAFFAFDEGEFKHVIARDIRLPRLLEQLSQFPRRQPDRFGLGFGGSAPKPPGYPRADRLFGGRKGSYQPVPAGCGEKALPF